MTLVFFFKKKTRRKESQEIFMFVVRANFVDQKEGKKVD